MPSATEWDPCPALSVAAAPTGAQVRPVEVGATGALYPLRPDANASPPPLPADADAVSYKHLTLPTTYAPADPGVSV